MTIPGAKFIDQNSQLGDPAGTGAGSGTLEPRVDRFVVQTDGQTAFTLVAPPSDPFSGVYADVNGKWLSTDEFTVVLGAFTFIPSAAGYTLQAGASDAGKPGPSDVLTVHYFVLIP